MSIVVQKYGGTSVADAARISNVARRIVETYDGGQRVCAVVSAPGDTTDDLIRLAHEVSPLPPRREMDKLLSAGERISCALVAMAVERLGRPAVSLSGSDAGIVTDAEHGNAEILEVRSHRVLQALGNGQIALVAGFQGISTENEVTTLGRGGSDTSAVALAQALGAEICEIYTDVDGVYTANPSVVPSARRIPELTFDEMIELATAGAEVLALRSVMLAMRHQLPLRVCSSFAPSEGTLVKAGALVVPERLCGVAFATDVVVVTISGVAEADDLGHVCCGLVSAGVPMDFILKEADGSISLVLSRESAVKAEDVLSTVKTPMGLTWTLDADSARVTVVGGAVSANPKIRQTVTATLEGIRAPVRWMESARSSLACLVPRATVERVVCALHDALELGTQVGAPDHRSHL